MHEETVGVHHRPKSHPRLSCNQRRFVALRKGQFVPVHQGRLGGYAPFLLVSGGDIGPLLNLRERGADVRQEGLSGFVGGRFCRLRDEGLLMSLRYFRCLKCSEGERVQNKPGAPRAARPRQAPITTITSVCLDVIDCMVTPCVAKQLGRSGGIV